MEQRLALLDASTLDGLREKAALLKAEMDGLQRDKTRIAHDQKLIEATKSIEDLYTQVNFVPQWDGSSMLT